MDSLREEYAPEPSCQFNSVTTKNKRKSQLYDSMIQKLKLSDEDVASVSQNENLRGEDEKRSEDDEFPNERPVLYNHAIDLG